MSNSKSYGNFLSVSTTKKFNNFENTEKILINHLQANFCLLLLYLIYLNKFWTILPCMLNLWIFSPWKVDQMVMELHNFKQISLKNWIFYISADLNLYVC